MKSGQIVGRGTHLIFLGVHRAWWPKNGSGRDSWTCAPSLGATTETRALARAVLHGRRLARSHELACHQSTPWH
eukprot:3189098-Prymnesium_polylepis.1